MSTTNKKDLNNIGNIYGQLLNPVKKQLMKEGKTGPSKVKASKGPGDKELNDE